MKYLVTLKTYNGNIIEEEYTSSSRREAVSKAKRDYPYCKIKSAKKLKDGNKKN